MKSLITCAGFGTRHQNGVFKHLTKYKDEAVIKRLVDHLSKVSDVYILTNDVNYKSLVDLDLYAEIISNGVKDVKDKKGAIGDIQHFLNEVDVEDLAIFANDTYFSYQDIVNLIKSKEPALLVQENNDKDYLRERGNVETENSYIKNFVEKPEDPKSNLVAYMAYRFTPECVDEIRKYKGDKDNGGTLIEHLINKFKIRAIEADVVYEI